MQLIVNGETVQIAPVDTLQDFIKQQQNLPKQYAIAVNGAFVAQGTYGDTPIQEGDDIELLVPMQGG